ncbi:MAG: energy-coupling factor ABC transporter ATP-binding protein [Promethearchaeota archaeon]
MTKNPTNPLIKIENVFFRYRNQDKYVLKDINLSIYKGAINLICGPTGSGKTTLIRLFNGLIPFFHEGELSGSIIVDGTNTINSQTSKLAQVVGMVFQNPDNQLVSASCEREIAFGPENLGLPTETIKERVEFYIRLLNLEAIRKSSPIALSGGQKQKIAIASALALRPKILVFDEPSSNLDPKSTKQLYEIIQMINKKYNITIIIVEHRLELFLQIATHVTCMNDGKIVLQGRTCDVINDPAFFKLGIQVPTIIRLFKKLKENSLYEGSIPLKIDDGLEILIKLKQGSH